MTTSDVLTAYLVIYKQIKLFKEIIGFPATAQSDSVIEMDLRPVILHPF